MAAGDLLKNRYLIRQVLGSGSQGVVYLAEDIESNHELKAIKMFRETITSEKNASLLIEDTNNEIKQLKGYNHENIITYFGHFIHQDHIYIILEYCQVGI